VFRGIRKNNERVDENQRSNRERQTFAPLKFQRLPDCENDRIK
jgi:hypothetical protein